MFSKDIGIFVRKTPGIFSLIFALATPGLVFGAGEPDLHDCAAGTQDVFCVDAAVQELDERRREAYRLVQPFASPRDLSNWTREAQRQIKKCRRDRRCIILALARHVGQMEGYADASS